MENPYLIIASGNLHKIAEIKEMMASLDLEVFGLPELGVLSEVVEDGDTFLANAKKKAEEISKLTGAMVLADDSGLEVDALQGAPGVFSARYAGEPTDDERNNDFLLDNLRCVSQGQRGAQFRCVVALAQPGQDTQFSEGICRGEILLAPRGSGGFGYDPLFLVPEYDQTFAELPAKVKNRISHRFLAIRRMIEILQSPNVP